MIISCILIYDHVDAFESDNDRWTETVIREKGKLTRILKHHDVNENKLLYSIKIMKIERKIVLAKKIYFISASNYS